MGKPRLERYKNQRSVPTWAGEVGQHIVLKDKASNSLKEKTAYKFSPVKWSAYAIAKLRTIG